jgi:hypothetical protein
MPTSTRRPPPPDPIDAADEALARARAANARFRNADDFEEPTGRHEAQPMHFHIEVPREALASVHDQDIPKKNPVLALIAGIGTLVLGLLATAHVLGLF